MAHRTRAASPGPAKIVHQHQLPRFVTAVNEGATQMEHVVFFPAHDGSPAFRRVGNLQDAVRLVEHLRNVENVSEVSVHSLAEVPLAFKPYYKVEVPADEAGAPAAAPEPIAVPGLAPEVVPPALVEVPEQADAPSAAAIQAEAPVEEPAEEKSGAASLGFFAS